MKQLLAGIILLLLIGGITMIAEYEPPFIPKPVELPAHSDPSVYLLPDPDVPVAAEGARFYLCNATQSDIDAGEPTAFALYQKIDGLWYSAEHQVVDSIALSYCLSPGRRKALELQDGWSSYGRLSPGKYCIVVYYYGWDEQGTRHALYTFDISE